MLVFSALTTASDWCWEQRRDAQQEPGGSDILECGVISDVWQRAPKLGVQICKSRCLHRARSTFPQLITNGLVNRCH